MKTTKTLAAVAALIAAVAITSAAGAKSTPVRRRHD